jgi:hypothetical protein
MVALPRAVEAAGPLLLCRSHHCQADQDIAADLVQRGQLLVVADQPVSLLQ